MNIDQLHSLFLASGGISTDTRKIEKGKLFFALKGENFNANHFAEKALKLGASHAVIDEKEFHLKNGKTILVDDSLITLQHLATFHRNYLKLPIIALTGSNGKTTTKELIHAVLSQKYKTVATSGNLNNHIGVPLTLLSMDKQTEIGVVEMGANHPGEIDFLCTITQPDYGYITNFGKAHLEGFGSLEGVIKAKTELYRYLEKNNKEAFINTDDKTQLAHAESLRKFTFGTQETNDLSIKPKQKNPCLSVSFNNTEVKTQLTGVYNFSNIAAAIAIGVYFKIIASQIKTGIENYTPANNRSQFLNKNSNVILLDAYNANPTSMQAAIENFAQLDARSKILFLGDMFELGPGSLSEHEKIALFATTQNFDAIYLVGETFSKTNIQKENIKKFSSFEALKALLVPGKFKNSHILIKGSRGMAMERITELI